MLGSPIQFYYERSLSSNHFFQPLFLLSIPDYRLCSMTLKECLFQILIIIYIIQYVVLDVWRQLGAIVHSLFQTLLRVFVFFLISILLAPARKTTVDIIVEFGVCLSLSLCLCLLCNFLFEMHTYLLLSEPSVPTDSPSPSSSPSPSPSPSPPPSPRSPSPSPSPLPISCNTNNGGSDYRVTCDVEGGLIVCGDCPEGF